METISDTNSKNFIDRVLIKKLGLNIYQTEYIKYLSSKRNIQNYVDKIIVEVKRTEKEGNFPLYVLLNIIYNSSDNKHAEVIVITKNKSEYVVGLFDSNGKLGTLVQPDKNVRQIIDLLGINLKCETYEFMEKESPINTVGKGNCDELALWFMYINSESKNKTDVITNLNGLIKNMNPPNNRKDNTILINKQIIKLSK